MKKQIKRLSVAQVQRHFDKMKSERQMWHTHWQEIADFFLTNKNTITNMKSEGQKRNWQLLDNTGSISLETLAAALNGFLTNPNEQWFEMSFGDPAIDKIDQNRGYLQTVTTLMHAVLKLSNFTTAMQEFYPDLVGFGTGTVFVDEDDTTIVSFIPQFIRDYYIDEGRDGRINTVYRDLKMPAHDMVMQFGEENLPKKVMDAYKKGETTKFSVIHAVYPEYLCSAVKKKTYKWVSQYILIDEKLEISYGEYMEFPYGSTRWSKAVGEKYGRSPAMTALPEMKVLNKMNETMLIGAQKMVDPPIQLPDDGFVLPIITTSGGINYYRAGSNDRIETMFNTPQLDFGYQAMEDRRKRVREAFFIDQLRLPQGGPMMTATEVAQRKQEGMLFLGPMFGRIEPEFLRTVLQRVYNIMARKGLIPPAPEQATGRALEVKFIGLIAKSHETMKGQSIAQLLANVAPFMQMKPQTIDNFNVDSIVRILASAYNVPQDALFNLDQVIEMRNAQAAAQQKQAQMQQQQMQETQTVDNALTTAKAVSIAQGI